MTPANPPIPRGWRAMLRDASVFTWPLAITVIGLLVTAVLAWAANAGSRARDAVRFENALQHTSAAIQTRLEVYLGLLRATAGYFSTEPASSEVAFRSFVERIDPSRNYPGIQGIGYAPRVLAGERDRFSTSLRAREEAAPAILPLGDRPEYFPIQYIEPLDERNRKALGYDMFSEPVRQAAMVRARDAGQASVSGRVVLVQEIDRHVQAGFLIYVPVYRGGGVPVTVAARRERLEGFVYSPFRADDLFAGIFAGQTQPRVQFEVYDGSGPETGGLLYRSPNEPAKDTAFSRSIGLQVGDRSWTVTFRATPHFEAGSARDWTAWVALGGVLLSGMFGTIALGMARAEARSRQRGRELAEEREQLRVTLASIGDGVISTDAAGGIVFMNGVAEAITGWTLAEIRGRALRDVFPLGDDDTRAIDPIAGRGGGRVKPMLLRAKDGAIVPIDHSAAPIRTASGELAGMVRVFHDVTEKHRAEEALRVSEARKDAILRSAIDAIITFDHESRVVEFNPAAERIFGCARRDVLGRPLVDLLATGPRRDEAGRDLVHHLAAGDGPMLGRQIELPAKRADGAEFPAELAIVPIPGTQPPMYTAFLRDITERKEAERRVREAAERFRFMAESMPQKIFTARPDGAFDYFNRQWTNFTGLPLAELAAGGWERLIAPEDIAEYRRRWQRAIADDVPFQGEHRIRRQDGEYRWHLTRAHALRDAAGSVVMWIGSMTDIDDQKRAEERLEKTVADRTAALRETNEQLEAFVYSIAHDLRGPLRSINGYAYLLAEDYASALDNPGRHLIQRIQTSAEFMDRLILDLLAFGRTAREEIELATVDVRHAWNNATEQHATRIAETGAHIETVAPLPRVRAHEATLGQVLANLLGNALKFVAPGAAPRVRFRGEVRGAVARLWIEDNGIGIPAEMHERIFRVFERLHGPRYEGTGIGLSIVRKGIERMGGRVGVESEPGQGARFWIELPLAE